MRKRPYQQNNIYKYCVKLLNKGLIRIGTCSYSRHRKEYRIQEK